MNTTAKVQPSLALKVVARSSNTNSFGLREHVIVAKNGLAFRALLSAYTPEADRWVAGTERTLGLGWDLEDGASREELSRRVLTALGRYGFECCGALPDFPKRGLSRLFLSVASAEAQAAFSSRSLHP